MKLIGLTGRARAGKDTAAGFIEEWAVAIQHRTVARDAFADRLKRSAAAALGYEGDDPVGLCNAIKHDGEIVTTRGPWSISISGREFLQRYGTEAHREIFGSDFWVEQLFDNLNEAEIVVITDCRFENEARAIRERGGQVWEVKRPQHADELEGDLAQHASEAGVPVELVDRVIHNAGDLEDFRHMVRRTCELALC